jgi:hypothetical protein
VTDEKLRKALRDVDTMRIDAEGAYPLALPAQWLEADEMTTPPLAPLPSGMLKVMSGMQKQLDEYAAREQVSRTGSRERAVRSVIWLRRA